jgi:DNA-binding SARP family transcriptional activator/tetratricopeptide (TPR) repeat protein
MPLRVGVLGPVTVWRDGREVTAGQPKQLAVLGLLASRANRVVSRGQLVDAVWGDRPPVTAEGGIYTYVAGLRRVLEPHRLEPEPAQSGPDAARPAPGSGRPRRDTARVLVSSGGGYLLRLADGGLDAAYFEERLARSRELRAVGDLDRAASMAEEALSVWRGQPFAGIPGPFAEGERQRLAELRTAAIEERAGLMLARGQDAAAVPELTALVAEHPLREQARGLLMVALYRCGRQAEALHVFHEARQRLANDLGLDPGSELTRIHQQLLVMDPALDSPAILADAPVLPVRAPAPADLSSGAVASPAVPPASAVAPPGSPPAGSRPAAAAASSGATAPCPAQLPPEPAGFVGRAAALGWLHGLLPTEPGREHHVAPIALITGTAGVGKTTLAIRFAREAAPYFRDGQLYVNLRGFDPGGAPMPPGTALQWFFNALGVPARNVPSDLDAQSALLRTLLDGKRMLLLLDNARDADQVRPLLPGSGGCVVLVTSRSQLTGLVVSGARPLPLDVLDPAESAELVAGRLGAERAAAESAAVAALVGHSAGLPLALSVTCARAAARPGLRLADLAAELADARGRLDALGTGEPTTDLRAVFSWSADKLSEPAGRMFRLLGLHAGPGIAPAAAASLAGVSLPAARVALAELTRASLLTEDAAGRFGCHDLLRAYAAELAAQTLDPVERDQAGRRVLDYYLRTAHAAAARLYPAHGLVALPAAADGVHAEEFAGADAYDAAQAWFGAEHRVLGPLIDQAATQHYYEYCWQLAWHWAPMLNRRGLLHELLAVQQTAVLAAGRLHDRDALAHVHSELGGVHVSLGDYAAADEHLQQALELFTDLGDQASVGTARHRLAWLLSRQGRHDEALDHAVAALRLRRALADQAAIAYSENAVGFTLAHLGQADAALWYCRRALEMHRESGSRTGEADTLDSIAFAYGQRADYHQAAAYYEQAIALYRLLGDRHNEAGSRQRLGDMQVAAGRPDAARDSWNEARALRAQIPGADMREVGDRLSTVKLRLPVSHVSLGKRC